MPNIAFVRRGRERERELGVRGRRCPTSCPAPTPRPAEARSRGGGACSRSTRRRRRTLFVVWLLVTHYVDDCRYVCSCVWLSSFVASLARRPLSPGARRCPDGVVTPMRKHKLGAGEPRRVSIRPEPTGHVKTWLEQIWF